VTISTEFLGEHYIKNGLSVLSGVEARFMVFIAEEGREFMVLLVIGITEVLRLEEGLVLFSLSLMGLCGDGLRCMLSIFFILFIGDVCGDLSCLLKAAVFVSIDAAFVSFDAVGVGVVVGVNTGVGGWNNGVGGWDSLSVINPGSASVVMQRGGEAVR
jgi:hypothetical protein